MTQEIIEMARDSGMELYGLGKDRARFVHHLEAFAKLVAEAEREAFAKIQFESILQAIKIEREACKQIIRETPVSNWFQADVIEAIDKRGQA
jgi:hypothetical protein